MMARIGCLVIGYIFGLFQTAYIYGKAKGIDIRKVGSGNAGTTNAIRAFGSFAGILVFAGDCLKCVLAIFATKALFGGAYAEILPLLRMYTGLGCILGHNYPFYMQFKGGKGIACTAGIFMHSGLMMAVAGLAAFFIPTIVTHYVSLGSLIVNAMLLLGNAIGVLSGHWNLSRGAGIEMLLVTAVIVILAVYSHRENIARLRAGEERKTYLFRKK